MNDMKKNNKQKDEMLLFHWVVDTQFGQTWNTQNKTTQIQHELLEEDIHYLKMILYRIKINLLEFITYVTLFNSNC